MQGQEELGWLLNGEFERLSSKLDPLLAPKQDGSDFRLESALEAFARQERAIGTQMDAWIAAKPTSASARLLRANYLMHQGLRSRGEAFISQTSPEQLEGMRQYFRESRADLETVKALAPQSAYPYAIGLEMAMRSGGKTPADKTFQAGIERDPKLVWLYATNLMRLAPKWGGSEQARDAFVRSIRQQYDQYPRLKSVEVQWRIDQVEALPGKPCDKVEQYQSVYNFYRDGTSAYYLGKAYSCGRQFTQALPLLKESVEYWPYRSNAWRVIGAIEHDQGNHEAGLRATHHAAYLAPFDDIAHFQEGEIAVYLQQYERAATAFHNASLAADNPFYYGQYEELARGFMEAPEEPHELVILETRFGPMVSETTYQNGRKEGISIEFKNNRPAAKRRFVNDQLVFVSQFNESGQVVTEFDMDRGQANGPYTEYSAQGKVISKGLMVDGKRQGDIPFFFANGATIYSQHFESGKRQGATEFSIPSQKVGNLNIAAITTGEMSRIYTPLDKRDMFKVDSDHPVFVFAVIDGIETAGHEIGVTFTDATGREVFRYEQKLIPDQERFNPHTVYYNPDQQRDQSGEWQVDVYIDNQRTHRLPITVTYL
ncbi:hypothetical protein ACTXGQ_18130 [Marinobacter sp. 1Y8]